MSRRYRDVRSSGFSLGEIAPASLADPDLYLRALQTGRNVLLTSSSTLIRRPGSELVNRLSTALVDTIDQVASGRRVMRTVAMDMTSGAERRLLFTTEKVTIFDESGTVEATLTGPWDVDAVHTMSILVDKDQLFIVHADFWPRTISFDGTSWSIADFAFREDPNGRQSLPFESFISDVILTPSAYTGTITVTFDDDVLVSDHVGVRFLIAFGTQIEITAVTSATQGTATVHGVIFPTQTVGVDDASAFTVGDIVEGDVTGIDGQVVAISGTTLTVVNLSDYTLFSGPETVDSVTVPGENLVGPSGSAEVTSVSQASAPSGTNIWFEQMISAVRGYPSCATLHRRRLIFGGFQDLPNYICASATNSFGNFDVRAGEADDAIIEAIGNASNEMIQHLVSLEQLVILTNQRCLYVSEGPQQAFTPSGIAFDNIGPEVAGPYPPTVSSEGVLFIDKRDRVILLSITGAVRGTWKPLELTRLAHHMIVNPVAIMFSPGCEGRPERMLIVLNDDGSLAVFSYPRGGEQGGWTRWDRDDLYHSVFANRAELYVVAGGGAQTAIERVSAAAVIDAEHVTPSLALQTFDLRLGDLVVGTETTDGAGAVSGFNADDMKLGHDFHVEVEPAPYRNAQVGRLRRRIYEAFTNVTGTGPYRVAGRLHMGSGFDYDRSGDAPFPLYEGEHRTNILGFSEDGTIKIEQWSGEGGPFHLRAITMRIRGN